MLATAGVVTFGGGNGGHELSGEVRVAVGAARGGANQSGGFAGDGASCGTGGSRGVGEGTTVTVTSAKGDELGVTELGEGRVDRTLTSTTCVFDYSVDGVADAGMYVIEVGDRRAARATRDSIEQAGWQLDVRVR